MKTEFEPQDIQSIASAVAEIIKPMLTRNIKQEKGETIFDVKELAEYLKVDESWIYNKSHLREIPHFKIGKYIRFKKSAIDKWIESETIRPLQSLQVLKTKRCPADC